jgi:transposase
MDEEANRRRRRTYSAEFRAEAVAACRKPGASTSAEPLKRSMNANVLRRWAVEAERVEGAVTSARVRIPRDGEQGFHWIVNTDSTAT